MTKYKQLAYGDIVNLSPNFEEWYRKEYPGYTFFSHDVKPDGWKVLSLDRGDIALKQGCVVSLRVPRRFISKVSR